MSELPNGALKARHQISTGPPAHRHAAGHGVLLVAAIALECAEVGVLPCYA